MPQSVYRITTDQGTYNVTVDDAAEGQQATPLPPGATRGMPSNSTMADVAPTPTRAQSALDRTMRPLGADMPQPTVDATRRVVDWAKENPAQAGAMVGATAMSLATGGLSLPASAALVGLAGAGGAGYGLTAQQVASGTPEPVDRSLATMAEQGALSAAGEGGGRALVAGAKTGASWLMNRATSRISARLAMDFPELSDTLIQEAITVSKGGLSKARHLLKLAKDKATAALTTAEKAGATVPIQLTDDLAESLKTAAMQASIKAGQTTAKPGAPVTMATDRLPASLKVLFNSIDSSLQNGTPLALSPVEADMLKTQLQRQSRSLYIAMRGPNGTPAIERQAGLTAEFASRLNDAIDGVATGYKAANAEAQPLIGAVRGVQQSIRPSGNLMQAMVRPAVGAVVGETAAQRGGVPPYIGGVAGAALMSPAGMSRQAILLANPTMQALLRQMPRTTAAALSAFLASPESQLQPSHSPQPPAGSR